MLDDFMDMFTNKKKSIRAGKANHRKYRKSYKDFDNF